MALLGDGEMTGPQETKGRSEMIDHLEKERTGSATGEDEMIGKTAITCETETTTGPSTMTSAAEPLEHVVEVGVP